MPSSYSSLLRLELPAIGEQSNTWGTTVNRNLGTLLEKSIAGAVLADVSTGDVTLTSANGADDQARCAIMLISGLPGVVRNIIAPALSKTYVVYNGSNAATIIKAPLTTGIALNVGEYAFITWNGLDFVRVGVTPISPSFTGTPTVPTAAVDTNSSQIASTAYVIAQGYIKAATAALTYAPLNGVGTSGTWPITAGNAQLLDGIDSTGFFQNASLGTVALANIDNARASGIYTVDHGGFSSLLLEYAGFVGNSAARVQLDFQYADEIYFRVARDTQTQFDGAAWNTNRVVHTGWFNPVGGTGASGTWNINITGAVNGYSPAEVATASTLAARTSAGYLYSTYFNQNSASAENPTIGSFFVESGSDGFLRKGTIANVKTQLFASPSFTGTPVTVTPAANTNTTQVASTAFVQSALPAAFNLTYSNVTGSRSAGTPFTNSSGHPAFISITVGISAPGAAILFVGGVQMAQAQLNSSGGVFQLTALVPNGATYQLNVSGGTTINLWTEI